MNCGYFYCPYIDLNGNTIPDDEIPPEPGMHQEVPDDELDLFHDPESIFYIGTDGMSRTNIQPKTEFFMKWNQADTQKINWRKEGF